MREARRAFSAHCSRDAAAITDLSEQPETPGPQPRQGSKAAAVPVMEKMEFSSKSPGFRPEVSARVVESGRSSPEAAELAELLALLEKLPDPLTYLSTGVENKEIIDPEQLGSART